MFPQTQIYTSIHTWFILIFWNLQESTFYLLPWPKKLTKTLLYSYLVEAEYSSFPCRTASCLLVIIEKYRTISQITFDICYFLKFKSILIHTGRGIRAPPPVSYSSNKQSKNGVGKTRRTTYAWYKTWYVTIPGKTGYETQSEVSYERDSYINQILNEFSPAICHSSNS